MARTWACHPSWAASASATSPRSVHDSRSPGVLLDDGDEIDQAPALDVVVDEVLAGSHPDLGRHFEIEMGEPIGRHQPAIGDAAGEAGLFGTEQGATHRRVDAVGPHQRVDADVRAVLELGLDVVAVIDERP